MADNHWRNTMRPARFFILDARAAFPFLLCLVHFRVYTLVIAGLITLVLWVVEQRGYTFDAALRWFRAFLIAPKRPAVPRTVLRRSIDFGEKPWYQEAINQKAPQKMRNTNKKPSKTSGVPRQKSA